jgi:hypothetical protein
MRWLLLIIYIPLLIIEWCVDTVKRLITELDKCIVEALAGINNAMTKK